MPVDPIIQRVIRLAYRNGHGALPSKNVAEVRAYYKQKFNLVCSDATFESITLPNQIRIHLFKCSATQPRPLLIYLRASAYVMGTIEDAHSMCRFLMRATGCHVAAIEPRLAPETPFPTGFNDCITAIQYLKESAAQYEIDVNRIALWGESSGGNMAAALSHILNQDGPRLIKLQILFYPLLDYSKTIHYLSKDAYGHGFMMDNDLTDWFLDRYAPNLDDRHDVRVSPLLAPSIQHLPATLILAAECDPMRDEAVAYYQKLIASGIDAQIVLFPGMIHGFLWYAKSHATPKYAIQLAVREILKSLRGA